MIFYFSGNGNSRWVAQQIASATGDTAVNMSAVTCDEAKRMSANAKRIGIIFPIHSWAAPLPVSRFVKTLNPANTPYVYAICTCGDDAGKAIDKLRSSCHLDAAWSLQMPNTYTPMFDLDDSTLVSSKLKNAYDRISSIAQKINHGESEFEITEGKMPRLKTYVINPLFHKFMVRTKGFHINGECNKCGTCVAICPMSNITLGTDGPTWGKDCTHCMGCLHSCPRGIIDYGKTTRRRGQYNLRKELLRNGISFPTDKHD